VQHLLVLGQVLVLERELLAVWLLALLVVLALLQRNPLWD
jgi:hypothetical protein